MPGGAPALSTIHEQCSRAVGQGDHRLICGLVCNALRVGRVLPNRQAVADAAALELRAGSGALRDTYEVLIFSDLKAADTIRRRVRAVKRLNLSSRTGILRADEQGVLKRRRGREGLLPDRSGAETTAGGT